MYNYQAKLVLKQYIPKQLDFGMLFIMMVEDNPQIIELTDRWYTDESVISQYGYPVEMYIVEENDESDIICNPEDIGWFDEGEESDSLIEFSLKQANYILSEYDGLLEIQIDEDSFDEDESVIPIYVDQKVIIKYIDDDELI